MKWGLSRSKLRGFTLIEMMVVISIFVIITGVVLANVPSFRNKTSLDLVAEEVALAIRQTQVYGIGTKTFSQSATSFPSYGAYFSPGLLPNGFILFGDTQPAGPPLGDNHYNSGVNCQIAAGSECLEKFALTGGIIIDKLQACSDENTCQATALTELDILFQRGAGADAQFNAVPAPSPAPALVKVRLKLPANGTCREVLIWKTGHIYVYNPSSCA
jgi:prepilin-type N-terminal cleavage/methylation domain-containing protein